MRLNYHVSKVFTFHNTIEMITNLNRMLFSYHNWKYLLFANFSSDNLKFSHQNNILCTQSIKVNRIDFKIVYLMLLFDGTLVNYN